MHLIGIDLHDLVQLLGHIQKQRCHLGFGGVAQLILLKRPPANLVEFARVNGQNRDQYIAKIDADSKRQIKMCPRRGNRRLYVASLEPISACNGIPFPLSARKQPCTKLWQASGIVTDLIWVPLEEHLLNLPLHRILHLPLELLFVDLHGRTHETSQASATRSKYTKHQQKDRPQRSIVRF